MNLGTHPISSFDSDMLKVTQLTNRGTLAWRHSEFEKAQENYQAAICSFDAIKDKTRADYGIYAYCHTGLGMALQQIGKHEEADQKFKAAIFILTTFVPQKTTLNYRQFAVTYYSMAYLAHEIFAHPEAADNYIKEAFFNLGQVDETVDDDILMLQKFTALSQKIKSLLLQTPPKKDPSEQKNPENLQNLENSPEKNFVTKCKLAPAFIAKGKEIKDGVTHPNERYINQARKIINEAIVDFAKIKTPSAIHYLFLSTCYLTQALAKQLQSNKAEAKEVIADIREARQILLNRKFILCPDVLVYRQLFFLEYYLAKEEDRLGHPAEAHAFILSARSNLTKSAHIINGQDFPNLSALDSLQFNIEFKLITTLKPKKHNQPETKSVSSSAEHKKIVILPPTPKSNSEAPDNPKKLIEQFQALDPDKIQHLAVEKWGNFKKQPKDKTILVNLVCIFLARNLNNNPEFIFPDNHIHKLVKFIFNLDLTFSKNQKQFCLTYNKSKIYIKEDQFKALFNKAVCLEGGISDLIAEIAHNSIPEEIQKAEETQKQSTQKDLQTAKSEAEEITRQCHLVRKEMLDKSFTVPEEVLEIVKIAKSLAASINSFNDKRLLKIQNNAQTVLSAIDEIADRITTNQQKLILFQKKLNQLPDTQETLEKLKRLRKNSDVFLRNNARSIKILEAYLEDLKQLNLNIVESLERFSKIKEQPQFGAQGPAKTNFFAPNVVSFNEDFLNAVKAAGGSIHNLTIHPRPS